MKTNALFLALAFAAGLEIARADDAAAPATPTPNPILATTTGSPITIPAANARAPATPSPTADSAKSAAEEAQAKQDAFDAKQAAREEILEAEQMADDALAGRPVKLPDSTASTTNSAPATPGSNQTASAQLTAFQQMAKALLGDTGTADIDSSPTTPAPSTPSPSAESSTQAQQITSAAEQAVSAGASEIQSLSQQAAAATAGPVGETHHSLSDIETAAHNLGPDPSDPNHHTMGSLF